MQGQRKRNVARRLGLSAVGPGGINCPCCGIAPKQRRQHFRLAKKREKRMAARYEQQAEYPGPVE